MIPEHVKEIGESAFYKCENLSEIELPRELEYIGENTFGDCSSLKKIIIPTNVKRIEKGAFGGCTNLEDVKFEGNPEYIGSSFYETKYYDNIEEDQYGCKYVQNHVVGFVDKGKNEIIIKEGTVSIADDVFSGLAFEKVIFPKELKYIGDFAFSFCKNLKRVELPQNLISVGEYEFQFCDKLEYIYIPESVKEIGEMSFVGCDRLKEVVMTKEVADKFWYISDKKVRYID